MDEIDPVQEDEGVGSRVPEIRERQGVLAFEEQGRREARGEDVGELAVGNWSVELDQAAALPNATALTEEVYGIIGANILLNRTRPTPKRFILCQALILCAQRILETIGLQYQPALD